MTLYTGNVIRNNNGEVKIIINDPVVHKGKIFKNLFVARLSDPSPREPIDLIPYLGKRIEFEAYQDTTDRAVEYHTAYGITHITPLPGIIGSAIIRFAPEVRLYPDEEYRPSSVNWYLSRVHMRYHRTRRIGPIRIGRSDVQILNKGEVNVSSLISQTYRNQNSGTEEKTDFFLQIPNDGDEEATRRGNLSTAVCYVHFRRAPKGWDYDIQYWFFYPYDGNITPRLKFEHEGDWEHITVRVTEDLKTVKQIFFATHEQESKWHTNDFTYNSEGHPIVYSAKHSHASYWRADKFDRSENLPGPLPRVPLPPDYTAEDGPIWETWKNLTEVGEIDAPVSGQEWIKYSGRWGELGAWPTGSVSTGPYSPSKQPWWKDDDKMP